METVQNENLKNIKIVGIDFGTSNTTVSFVHDDGFPQLLTNIKYGKTVIPSAVGYDGQKYVFGQDALNLIDEKKQVWLNLKRELGQSCKKYTVNLGNNKVEEKTSEDLIVMYLNWLKQDILNQLGGNQFNVVISSPAYFNQDKRAMLQNCFALAGYNVISLLSEPTAACISYAHDNFIQNETVLVIDVGGGTTDIALIKYKDNNFEANPTNGNSDLGGVDFNNELVQRIINKLTINQAKEDTSWCTESMRRYIFEVVENCKKELSKHPKAKLVLSNIVTTANGSMSSFEYELTREEFAKITKNQVTGILGPVTQCLEWNNTDKSKINKILLIGGGSATWGIKQQVQQMFPKATIIQDSNAKYCVSKGNGIFGYYQQDFQKSIIVEKINKSIGVVVINPNNPREPIEKRQVLKIIHRGDSIPAYGSYTFRTSMTNQKDAEIIIVQGEGYNYESNALIGTVVLDNIGVSQAGVNKITVEFKVDNFGLLTVEVSDSIKYKKERKQIKLNHSWTTSDYIKLQKAKQNQEKAEAEAKLAENWTKYVKFYNKEYLRLQNLTPSTAIDFMRSTLAEIKEAIKAHDWQKVEELEKRYVDMANDVIWENSSEKQVDLRARKKKVVYKDPVEQEQPDEDDEDNTQEEQQPSSESKPSENAAQEEEKDIENEDEVEQPDQQEQSQSKHSSKRTYKKTTKTTVVEEKTDPDGNVTSTKTIVKEMPPLPDEDIFSSEDPDSAETNAEFKHFAKDHGMDIDSMLDQDDNEPESEDAPEDQDEDE